MPTDAPGGALLSQQNRRAWHQSEHVHRRPASFSSSPHLPPCLTTPDVHIPPQLARQALEASPDDPEQLCRRANLLRCLCEFDAAAVVSRRCRVQPMSSLFAASWQRQCVPKSRVLFCKPYERVDRPPPLLQLYERAAQLDSTPDGKFLAAFAHFLFETGDSVATASCVAEF